MEMTIDPSAVLAVLLKESSRNKLVAAARNVDLIAPGSITWEIGNALSSLFRRGSLNINQIDQAMIEFSRIPIRIADIDHLSALHLAGRHRIYAYDAYVIECAKRYHTALLSLDTRQREVALKEGIELVEGIEKDGASK